jgi:methionyl-tRNA formyltransferase
MLRVHIVTEDDPIYVVRFFEVFFSILPQDRIEISGITIAKAFYEPPFRTAIRIHKFYGTLNFLRLLARWSTAKLMGKSIEKLARSHGIPIVSAPNVNDSGFIDKIRVDNVDLIVSVAAPQTFKAGILAAPLMGCINIHSGRLPQYRGMMPTFWQLLAREQFATVTIHEMAEKLDAGGIIATRKFRLKRVDSLDRVIVGTKICGAVLMAETLLQYDSRAGIRPKTSAFELSSGAYHKFPDRKSISEFLKIGHRLL